MCAHSKNSSCHGSLISKGLLTFILSVCNRAVLSHRLNTMKFKLVYMSPYKFCDALQMSGVMRISLRSKGIDPISNGSGCGPLISDDNELNISRLY